MALLAIRGGRSCCLGFIHTFLQWAHISPRDLCFWMLRKRSLSSLVCFLAWNQTRRILPRISAVDNQCRSQTRSSNLSKHHAGLSATLLPGKAQRHHVHPHYCALTCKLQVQGLTFPDKTGSRRQESQAEDQSWKKQRPQQGGDQDPNLLHVGEHLELGSETEPWPKTWQLLFTGKGSCHHNPRQSWPAPRER